VPCWWMRLQAVVYPLAEIAQAEDVAALKGPADFSSQPAQHQQPARQAAATSSDAADADGPAAVGEETDAGAATAEAVQVDSCSDPAAVLRDVQQHMVHLTMLLCSRNLWMRPAVLEAPAQDPQYLEAIHKASSCCPDVTISSSLELIPATKAACPCKLGKFDISDLHDLISSWHAVDVPILLGSSWHYSH